MILRISFGIISSKIYKKKGREREAIKIIINSYLKKSLTIVLKSIFVVRMTTMEAIESKMPSAPAMMVPLLSE